MQLQTLANDLQKSLQQNNNKQRRRAISNELSALIQHRGIQNTDHSLIDRARELLEEASVANSPQKGSLSLTSGTGVMAITQSFPHILRQQRRSNNNAFEGFENEAQESAWQNLLANLSSFVNSRPTISIQQVLAFANDSVQHLKQLVKGLGANLFEGVFAAMVTALVDTVQRVNREMKKDISQLYALLTCCIYRQLSTSHRKVLSQALSKVVNEYQVLVPNLLVMPVNLQFVDQVAVLRYVCAIISYDSEVPYNFAVLEVGFIWRWLYRAGQQFHVLLQADRDHLTLSSALSVSQVAELLQKCITRAGYPLYLRYQQQFIQLVTALRQVIVTANNSACNDLKKDVDTLISKDQAPLPVFYHFQDAFEIDGMLAIQSIEEVDKQFKALESDRQGAFMQRVKALGIDRLRSIFNKISSTIESQQTAIAALLEKIVLSSQDSPEMLRYTMLKIVHNILQDCQETFFSEMNESGPTRLARVLNGLCQEITELQPVVRGLFSRTCPLIVPKILSEPTGESMDMEVYLYSLGYIKKQESWESQDRWLARMAKILSVFAVMCLLPPTAATAAGGQPPQLTFNLDVLWLWVVRVVNVSARCNDSPPLFVATMLEVVLKIGAPTLFRSHQKAFMDVMVLIEKKLLPKMMSVKDMPKREALKQFVETFVRSGGRESISLFSS